MAWNYYHQTPGFGSSSFQFSAPPAPAFQPQPSWSGADYYRAHYGGSDYDTGVFDWVWSRVKNFVTGGVGVGREEAKHWHRRVYGGMVDLASLSAAELGAAAGYEAYRMWDYHKSVYRQPLMDDRDREREALVGLAIAEANKLLAYVPQVHDRYGRREVSEVAAATAERIFRHYDGDTSYDAYEVGPRRRRSSYGGYISDDYDDYDDRHRRSRSRSRRLSQGGLSQGGLSQGGYYGQPAYVSTSPQPTAYMAAAQSVGMPGAQYAYPMQQQPAYTTAYTTAQPAYGVSPAGYTTTGGYAVYPQAAAPNVAYAYPATTATTAQAYAIPTTAATGQLVLQPHRRSRSHSHSYRIG